MDDVVVVEIINLETKKVTFLKTYKDKIDGDAINRMMDSIAEGKLGRSKLAVKGIISVDEWKLKERLQQEQGEAVGAKVWVLIAVATGVWAQLLIWLGIGLWGYKLWKL